MANTFKALVDYAEWDTTKKDEKKEKAGEQKAETIDKELPPVQEEADEGGMGGKLNTAQLHYNIQIHLPESRDQAVYDALFKSLKKHLF